MGLRCILSLLIVEVLLWHSEATSLRQRRQLTNNFPHQPSDAKPYQPPISLGAHPVPVAASATLQNSYQPPLSLIRSNEYQSPLNPPQNPYPSNVPRSYQPPVPQSYVIPNQPQHQSHSVQYVPPAIPSANIQQSYSVFQQPAPNSAQKPATSFSVHQQPPQNSQSFAILNSDQPHSTAERTYSTHSKVVASAHVPAQAIHKTPASEIQPDKKSAAKEKAAANDEYVVYYYYYYDNDTSANNNNLSLNFDDIPSLEGYDNDKLAKEPEKSASARTLAANLNSLTPAKPDASPLSETSSSQPRSVGDVYGHPDRLSNNPPEDTAVQPLKPVSNVFRYGSNEVPRFPVLPNFVVTEAPTTVKPEILTPDTLTTEYPTTQSAQINAQPDLKNNNDHADDDDLNNVLDNGSDLKPSEDKNVEEEPTTTTTTTTTEPPTTTEEPTTTTEKSRRRPSIGGGSRRRFNPSPSSSFTPTRNRSPTRSTSSTTSTSTTTSTPPTKRSFQGNRGVRPRPPIGSNRPRPGTRTTEANEDKAESKVPESTTASTTVSRSRFTSASPRRFQSSRSRSQSSSTTSTTTTRAPSSGTSSRSRPTSRPRPNLITRNRPARPGFPRTRPGSEPEEPETTTNPPVPTEQETSPETVNEELPSTNDESNETDEDEETSAEETEEPTTTEGSRFSALFKPRNRNAIGNRPRPVIGNRPSRS